MQHRLSRLLPISHLCKGMSIASLSVLFTMARTSGPATVNSDRKLTTRPGV